MTILKLSAVPRLVPFNSLAYFLFFPVVLTAYWLSPQSFRRLSLLVASYLFYMSWIPVYGLLLLTLTVANYGLGLAIARFRQQTRIILVFGLIANLSTLCFFKYANFLVDSLRELLSIAIPAMPHFLSHLFSSVNLPEINVILPLGISFFAFEFIHYISDVAKGDKPIKNPIDFALFAAFFPSQIAGPIKRYQDFEHQLKKLPTFKATKFDAGITLILQGLFKKVALSDNISAVVNPGFLHIGGLTTIDAWLATLAFALQIYFDFSGYTDMGRGSAMMLGFSLPDNFNLPYMAASLSDFWKRWHISLSSWLRDYLYIPLGGGRVSRLRKHFNLMVTMLLGGLWHGAAWHFVFWGGIHGLGLVVSHEYDELVRSKEWLKNFHSTRAGQALSVALTFLVVLIAWVFFRANTATDAISIIRVMFVPTGSVAASTLLTGFLNSTAPTALGAYSLYFLLSRYHSEIPLLKTLKVCLPTGQPARIALYAGAFFAAIGFSPSQSSPFIYFQF
jgi:alginate O-acetyltransferase complex protein AlgI